MDAVDTVLDCSVCLDSLPPDSGESEVTDYVAHYCGLSCYVRWHQHELPGELPSLEASPG